MAINIVCGAATLNFVPPSSIKIDGQLTDKTLEQLIQEVQVRLAQAKSALDRFDLNTILQELLDRQRQSPASLQKAINRLKSLRAQKQKSTP